MTLSWWPPFSGSEGETSAFSMAEVRISVMWGEGGKERALSISQAASVDGDEGALHRKMSRCYSQGPQRIEEEVSGLLSWQLSCFKQRSIGAGGELQLQGRAPTIINASSHAIRTRVSHRN